MKRKVLILSVMFSAFVLFGFALSSNLFSDLSEAPGFDGTPLSPMATGDSCFGSGQELHDDRSFENGGGWNATVTDGKILQKFTPTSYPWKYNKFCIGLTKLAAASHDSLYFDIMIYDALGAGGTPGAAKDSIMGLVARTIPTYAVYAWYSYDISAAASSLLNSGSVYIGIRYNAANQTNKFIMIDQSAATTLWPSYYSTNFGAWTTAATAWPSYKAFGMRTMGAPPVVPVGGNTLVIMNDSTTPTAQRTADRDTLRKYVNMLVGNVTYMTKNTTTVFPSLSGYSTIILQETAFDAVAVRSLVAGQRQALKDWLASGTAGAKKSLIMIGGDMGYAYDQTGQTQLDTVFSRSYGGFQYVSDNAAATAPFANVGQFPGSIFDVMSTTPPGGSYWPDGCRPISGGTTWETYQGRTALDSAAGIFKSGTGWNVITTFQDPRYYTGTGGGAGDMGFKRVLKNMCAWVRTNGGTITSVTPISGIVPEKFNLSQNYPNPFNPTTKINFTLPANGFVTLKVYNVTGQEVMTLVNENLHSGVYTVDFNGASLSSGAYFYRLESTNFVETKKMMLLK